MAYTPQSWDTGDQVTAVELTDLSSAVTSASSGIADMSIDQSTSHLQVTLADGDLVDAGAVPAASDATVAPILQDTASASYAAVQSAAAASVTGTTAMPAALDRWIVGEGRPINPCSPVYGAVGDGTTDDTAAIQAAINAGHIALPSRTFKVTGPLTIPDGRSFIGVGEGESTITNSTDTTTFTWSGGSSQTIKHLVINSWFTGARTAFDVDVTDPTKIVMEDVQINGATTATGNVGIRLTGDSNGNHYMPQLNRVWIRNGRLVVNQVSDGHMSDSYVWGNNNADTGTIDLSNISDGWSFNNVDVIPGTGSGAGYLFTNTNNVTITGGYADGSYASIATGHGIHAVNSGRIFVSGWHAFNCGRSAIRLESTNGCQFVGVGIQGSNKVDGSWPDIDLYSSSGSRFVTTHAQPTARTNKAGMYREDAASTQNDLRCTYDQSLGNNYGTPLVSANAGTLDPRSTPGALLTRDPAAPAFIAPPASLIGSPAAAAWPGAGLAIAHRFQIEHGAVYSNADVRVDTGSGSMQVAVLRMSGTSWATVLDSGVISCTAGNLVIPLSSAYLTPGEYALAVWVDNTNAQLRAAGYIPTRGTAEWTSASGIGASGTLTWNSPHFVSAISITN